MEANHHCTNSLYRKSLLEYEMTKLKMLEVTFLQFHSLVYFGVGSNTRISREGSDENLDKKVSLMERLLLSMELIRVDQ